MPIFGIDKNQATRDLKALLGAAFSIDKVSVEGHKEKWNCISLYQFEFVVAELSFNPLQKNGNPRYQANAIDWMQKNNSSHSSAIFRKLLDNLGNASDTEGVGDEPTVNQNQEPKQMKPLSYFIDTEFSRALMAEYGEYLELLRSDIVWVKSVACTVDDYHLAMCCHDNINYTSYTRTQRSLFTLALELYDKESSLARFREVLTEYS